MRTFATLAWAALVLTAVINSEAADDDLVAAVLPLSRSAQIGQTVTAFATVINSSGGALSGCTASSPNFSGTFVYQTTNPATNALTGSPNTPFSLPSGGSQSLVLALTPAAQITQRKKTSSFNAPTRLRQRASSGLLKPCDAVHFGERFVGKRELQGWWILGRSRWDPRSGRTPARVTERREARCRPSLKIQRSGWRWRRSSR